MENVKLFRGYRNNRDSIIIKSDFSLNQIDLCFYHGRQEAGVLPKGGSGQHFWKCLLNLMKRGSVGDP